MFTVWVWRIVIILWIYSGLVRNIFPSYQILIYSLPFLLSFTYTILTHPKNKSAERLRVFFLLYSTLICAFQTYHYLYSNLSFKVFISGIVLYLLAPTLVYVGVNSNAEISYSSFVNCVLVAIPINLFFVILQVIVRLNFYVTSQINEQRSMVTNDYVLRAMGTYSHPAGYSTFVSIATVVILYINNNLSFLSKLIWNTQLALLYLLSGSRTVWINLAIILAFDFYFGKRKNLRGLIKIARNSQKLIFMTFLLAFLFIYLKFKFIVDAFVIRLITSSAQENSLDRILSQMFGWLDKLTLSIAGSGLGFNSNANLAFAYQNPNWIEDDLTKIIVESGIFLGLTIVIFRLVLPILLARKLIKSPDPDSRFFFFNLARFFPT